LGRWEEAIAAYSKVLTTYDEEQQVCAGFVTALLKRAVALAKLGRCSEARRDLASVVTYRPPRGDQEFDNLRSMAKDLVARCGDESR
jgi:tetratricopeptide (TPR) repeat protein